MFWMLFIPLFAALLFDNIIVKIVCWVVTASVFFPLAKAYGASVVATMVGLLPLYIYFEWDNSPDWLAYVAGVLVFLSISVIRRRIKAMRALRESTSTSADDGNVGGTGSGSTDSEGR